MPWTKTERQQLDAAIEQLRQVVCKRVQERELDQLKLSRVAQCMDNWVRAENDAFNIHFQHLHRQLSVLQAKITEQEMELNICYTRIFNLENTLMQLQETESDSDVDLIH